MLRQDAFLRSVVPAKFSSKELADMLRFFSHARFIYSSTLLYSSSNCMLTGLVHVHDKAAVRVAD